MITSAEEFIRLRTSSKSEEYNRAAQEDAPLEVWFELVKNHPEMKEWVIHNKTIPVEILEYMVEDPDPQVRADIAQKRKLSTHIFDTLAQDPDERVKYALAYNTKNTLEDVLKISSQGSEWFQEQLHRRIEELKQETKS